MRKNEIEGVSSNAGVDCLIMNEGGIEKGLKSDHDAMINFCSK